MEFIYPNWDAPKHIKAVSTTRSGGFSAGVYEGFNLGLHVGDKPEAVEQNRRSLQQALNLRVSPLWLNQIHSTDIIRLVEPPQNDVIATADASITQIRGLACVVMTADCLPLLLTDSIGSQVAAVHVGWRGLANGIIEKAVAAFDCAAQELFAWTGPCIGAMAFEVGAEVREQLGGDRQYFKRSQNMNKFYADLPGLCRARLKGVGVGQVTSSNACTFSDIKRFYSYRRDGECGRMASLIWIEQA